MTTNITTADGAQLTALINEGAQSIAAKSLSRDGFNVEASITAQMTAWFGIQRGARYANVRILLTNEVMHRIAEAHWRLNVVAQMDGE